MNKLIKRDILKKIWSEIDSKEFIAIIGPRQVGKTTLLLQIQEKLLDKPEINKDQVIYQTFQDPLLLEDFNNNPVRHIKNIIIDPNKKTYILLDEFQFVDEAGKKLKLIYDTIGNIKIIITGSSSLQIKQIASSMVGRILEYELYHITLPELIRNQHILLYNEYTTLQRSFINFCKTGNIPLELNPSQLFITKIQNIIDDLIKFGNYPAIVTQTSTDKKITRLQNIYTTYIEKDIIQLLKIEKTQQFFKFIQYNALLIGQIFNKSALQTELDLRFEDITKFKDALEYTYITRYIRPFYQNKIKELKKSTIVYFLDTGLRNWIIRNFNNIDNREDRGHLIENYIFTRLRDLTQNQLDGFNINFWRTNTGAEIDFLLTHPSKYQFKPIPIEVKFRNIQKDTLTKSFHSFINTYRPNIGIIITKNYFKTKEVKGTKILFIPYYFI